MTQDDIHNQLKDRLANCRKLIEIARRGHFQETAWSDEEIQLLEKLLRKRSVDEVTGLLESLTGPAPAASRTRKDARKPAPKKRKTKKPAAKKKSAKKSSRKARGR